MSATEIFIIIGCLILGYWIASKVMDSKEKSQPSASNYSKPDEPPPNNSGKQEHWYEVLKVDRNATAEQIQEAYKKQIRQYHPDKVNNLGEELRNLAEEKSKAINIAYQTGLKVRGR
jgi:DnaJ-domain-containing protein 1